MYICEVSHLPIPLYYRLDYCNNLFYCQLKYSVNHMQSIQNSVVRIVAHNYHSTHFNSIIKSLHELRC